MKILYHHRIASKDGQYVHVESIINEFKKQGHDVVIVAPGVAENSDFGSDGGWVSNLREKLPGWVSEFLEFSYAFYAFFKLCVAIIKYKPDVIYERYNLFLPAGIWAKKLFGLPFQLEVNSPLYDERLKYGGLSLSGLAKWTEYYTWRNADRVLPVTHVLAKYIRDANVPDDKIKVIPNGVDVSVFTPQNHTNREDRFKDKIVVGFVGFCREWHQLDKVIHLLSGMSQKNIHFLVVGDGPVIAELNSTAKKLAFENSFSTTGLVPREEMPYWLDQIDIALQPAVTPWASPLKLIEYMAKGLAIVATDSENIRELLEDGHNALLFSEDSIEEMIKCIQVLITNTELRTKIRDGAAKSVSENQLTWQKNAQLITEWFADAVKARNKEV